MNWAATYSYVTPDGINANKDGVIALIVIDYSTYRRPKEYLLDLPDHPR